MVFALGLREILANRIELFISQIPFELSEAECRQRLVEMLLHQPRGNRTPFEPNGKSEKHCDSKQKAHRQNDDGLDLKPS